MPRNREPGTFRLHMRYRNLLGMLAVCAGTAMGQTQDFVWVFLNSNPNRPEIPKAEAESLQAGHMANIGRLAKEGKLLAAGPFYGGGGIFVFRRTSIDSARLWVSTDPAIKAGRFILDFYPYRPLVRSICTVGETYSMTTYHSVRFSTVAGKSADGEKVVSAAIAATRSDTLVAAGSFAGHGGFLVYQNAVDSTRFDGLNPVRDGSVTYVIKKLYIARGSFCEP